MAAHKILIIDSFVPHRRVIRHFIDKLRPADQLVEYDPVKQGPPGKGFDWSGYDLVIMDVNLGKYDGLKWFGVYRRMVKFPPLIFLVSDLSQQVLPETEVVISAMKLGAKDFLFKQHLQARRFNEALTEVLGPPDLSPPARQQPVGPKAPSAKAADSQAQATRPVGRKPAPTTDELKAVVDIRRQDAAVDVNETLHEVQLAMAMLEAHSEWPFTMEDIIAGRAMIDKYKIAAYMGKGSGWTTFRARDSETDEQVTIKLVSQLLMEQTDRLKRIQRNYQNLKAVNHPNLIRMLDYCQQAGRVYVVQEYLDGPDLGRRIKQGLREKQAIALFRQLLAALEQLHRHRLTAGPMTPKSLIFRDPDTLVLTQVGVIEELPQTNRTSGEQSIGQAPFYVSPEQVQGRHTDARSDLYLAGVFLYEMLSGRPPYDAGSIHDVLYAHVNAEIPQLPDSAQPINRIIHGLMMKTPSKRFGTVAEVNSELKRLGY